MPTVLTYRTRTVTTKVSDKVYVALEITGHRWLSPCSIEVYVEQPPLKLYMEVNGEVVLAAASGMGIKQ